MWPVENALLGEFNISIIFNIHNKIMFIIILAKSLGSIVVISLCNSSFIKHTLTD